MMNRRTCTTVLLALCLSPLARAQSGDARSVRILVGFPPGQATDAVARLLAERLSPALKESFGW